MKRKLVVFLLPFFMFTMILTGCGKSDEVEKYKEIDTEKAAEVATEYMTNKYGDIFELVSCEKRAEYINYIYGGKMKASWAEAKFTVKGDNTQKQYTVKINPDEDNSGYNIAWDNYMQIIVDPFFQKGMDEIISQIPITEYMSSISSSSQSDTDRDGFLTNFPVLTENDSFKDIISEYKVNFYFWLSIPISENENNLENRIEDAFKGYFSDDYVVCILQVYDNEDYSAMVNRKSDDETRYFAKERISIQLGYK